jgi:hypothetical protein
MKYCSGAHKHFLTISLKLHFLLILINENNNNNNIKKPISHFQSFPTYCTSKPDGLLPMSLYDSELHSDDETYILLKNGVFWDVTPCGSCKNRRFGGT